MDSEDLKAIGTLLDKKLDEKLSDKLQPISKTLEEQTGKLLEIEQKINAALELRTDVSEIRTTVKDHEERLTRLETL